MNQLMNIDGNSTDLSALYSTMNSGPILARARINKDSTTDIDGDMVEGIPAPSIGLSHPDLGEVFAKDTYFRIFLDTMQTSVFDSDTQKFSNMSQHFKQFSDTALDWDGGDKCGWIPSKQREKLRAVDPVAYATASKAKLYRNIFGLIRMDKPMAASGDKVEIKDVPFRMKLGPSNFMEISKVMTSMIRQQSMPLNFDLKIGYELKKTGSNKYFVLKYTPLLGEHHPLTDETREYITNFIDLVKVENDQVAEKMRENMVPAGIKTDLDDLLNDEIPL
jgi:hypothetical protein|tara:strand:+ start:775 stop:1605 length:831 start_codon:yes stop_codon:yes gene_type:complete